MQLGHRAQTVFSKGLGSKICTGIQNTEILLCLSEQFKVRVFQR